MAWILFFALVLLLLIFDLGILHRKDDVIGIRQALLQSAFYILIALCFGGGIYHYMGEVASSQYLTGYLVEKTLSLDNIFVIALIFKQLNIPREYQHRILFWGIIGVLLLRGIMIAAGAVVVARYSIVLDIFSLILIATGIKMWLVQANIMQPSEKGKIILYLKRWLPLTDTIQGSLFWIRHKTQAGKSVWLATPLFLALCAIESADVLFAIDSIPAIFTITIDPYIVYTSNIFAVLGLRALFFALDDIIHRFRYMPYALSLILVFIGSKLWLAYAFEMTEFPATVTLAVTVILLFIGIFMSLVQDWRKK